MGWRPAPPRSHRFAGRNGARMSNDRILIDAGEHLNAAGELIIAYNHCPTCDLITREAKYCPFCGPELQHVPPKRRCPKCTEQVIFDGANFCGWCGWRLADPWPVPE